ncbi:hypothetical protein LT679_02825 [Mucilaginibacter roseus]|uniref:Fibrobacter succinogenes major paralogous domain-containing protein n=1 Tax=Mucilaginibacter roseus TaxID=1528868 RepID=A0ABS8U184_9SPHI|nr:FISUMP domain-containing protein [Mucilaginibacter roseus]MCD8739524.1 hypothetical protein [Mucilaginibacter roseus]
MMISIAACKNDNDNNPEPSVESVTIDGTSYPTVKIGKQQWISINYSGKGGVFYNGDRDVKYGKLYTRKEAQAIKLQDGWRLPTRSDFVKLASNFPNISADGYVNLKPEGVLKLASSSGWRDKSGDNSSGFNALPAGICKVEADGDNDYSYRGIATQFISSTTETFNDNGATRARTTTFFLQIANSSSQPPTTETAGGVVDVIRADDYRFSVRFLRDID